MLTELQFQEMLNEARKEGEQAFADRIKQGWRENNKEVVQTWNAASAEPAVRPGPVSPLTKQVGGDHYKNTSIQPIEFIRANNLTFCEGSALKYITRHRRKNGKEDLEKAIHYLELEIEGTYGSKR